jgi:hypothetical protein
VTSQLAALQGPHNILAHAGLLCDKAVFSGIIEVTPCVTYASILVEDLNQQCESAFLSDAPNIQQGTALFQGSQTLPICPDKSYIKMKMSTQHRWNNTDTHKMGVTRKKPVPLPIFPIQTSQNWHWSRLHLENASYH